MSYVHFDNLSHMCCPYTNFTLLQIMKTFVVLAALLSVSLAFQFTQEWELWKKQYSKAYETDEEELGRHITWESNKLLVDNHNANADKLGYTLKMNQFADMVI